jgi:hypothetical protein
VPEVGFRNPKIGQDGRDNVYDRDYVASRKFVFYYDLPLRDRKEKSKK